MQKNNQDFFISYACLTESFKLSSYPLKVISLLIKATNHTTKCSYMSKRTLASKCECSISTISRALRELREKNLILIAPCMFDRKNNKIKRQTSNDYYVNFALLETNGTKIKAAGECTQLTGSELTVYNFIAKRVGNRKSFSLSRREIVENCNLSTSTVYYAIIMLEKKKLIAVERNKKNNVSLANDFSLIFKERSDSIKANEANPVIEINKRKLSCCGFKLFGFIQQCENYDCYCNEQQLSKRSGIAMCAIDNAVNELEHRQLLTRWHTNTNGKPQKWHYTLSAMFTQDEFPNALPFLPADVTNGEPFNIVLKDTIFELSSFTPPDVKLYSALRYLLQSNKQPSVVSLAKMCCLKTKDFNAALAKFTKAKYFTEKEGMVSFSRTPSTCWPLLNSNQYFSLSATQFTVFVFLYLICESNSKVYITTRSIAQYCKIPVVTINTSIKQLVDKAVIKTNIFYHADGSAAGRIFELVGMDDMGG